MRGAVFLRFRRSFTRQRSVKSALLGWDSAKPQKPVEQQPIKNNLAPFRHHDLIITRSWCQWMQCASVVWAAAPSVSAALLTLTQCASVPNVNWLWHYGGGMTRDRSRSREWTGERRLVRPKHHVAGMEMIIGVFCVIRWSVCLFVCLKQLRLPDISITWMWMHLSYLSFVTMWHLYSLHSLLLFSFSLCRVSFTVSSFGRNWNWNKISGHIYTHTYI